MSDQTRLISRLTEALAKQRGEKEAAIKALKQVSFYARINHGTKCKDYGEVVDPILVKLGVPTGEL